MKNEVLVFIFDGYADWEGAYICPELNSDETDYIVKAISFDKNPIHSMGSFSVVPDYSLEDCPKDFKALILLGGNAWSDHKNDNIKPIVDYAIENSILVAAICGATIFMADNNYINDIKHTSNTVDYLIANCPNYKGKDNYINNQAVTDKNIITANGTATLEFTREILLYLKAKSEYDINRWYEFHKKGFTAFITM